MSNFSVKEYHKILCPDFPDFLDNYINLPMMQRLSGIGLLCGTDWTPLFNNKFFYSRLDHSIGTALIIWNFTHSKKQALAGLFHDASTPSFSHVIDFKNGDALKQESTEDLNAQMLSDDGILIDLLKREGLYAYEVNNYHNYPIADNEMPGLSADRLEYMYPSGGSLIGNWTLEEIKENYSHIKVLENEEGKPELGFDNLEAAEIYTKKFCDISLVLQKNEDKVAMQLMADVVSRGMECGFIDEIDLYSLSEKDLIELFDRAADSGQDEEFSRLFLTFRRMTEVIHTDEPMENAYCVSLDVKQRYINPLVETPKGAVRVKKLSKNAKHIIDDFLDFKDTKYGCVPYDVL